MYDLRDKIPSWATNEEFKQYQKQAWESVSKELESIETGCVKRILE